MKISVQDVMNRLMEPAGCLNPTVDQLLCGAPDTAVTGIVTTFMATEAVIRQALALGANLIVSHEGIYYSHSENGDRLAHDPVYQGKKRLIEASGIAIFRFHDHIHRYRPDGIMTGLVNELEWISRLEKHEPAYSVITVPVMTVRELAEYVKSKLGVPYVRVVGNLQMPCKRVGLLAGYRGGGPLNIPLFEKESLDVILAGEGPEWETPEYVRDAVSQGRRLAWIQMGHAASEEPGMKFTAELLRGWFPDLPVSFVTGKHDFQWV
ncbi:Nif3-like dinuclear metal center hexameric protein [Gorillibacterium sp. sgz5001074]|uniref:Nif3-like dinuclear metal center hexameric protein n=1 Tax=Gorillibacterium sp. sgz5001074 TaxID=3446695 RepID=UPI003F673EF8